MMLLAGSPKYRLVADVTDKTIMLGNTCTFFFFFREKTNGLNYPNGEKKQLMRDVSTPAKKGIQVHHALQRPVSSFPEIFECLL